jgi:hypothetical protein
MGASSLRMILIESLVKITSPSKMTVLLSHSVRDEGIESDKWMFDSGWIIEALETALAMLGL